MDKSLNSLLDKKGIQALILDMDGVVTKTADTHALAWKKMFDNYLEIRAEKEGIVYNPLKLPEDYRLYLDGIPRHDGVRNFLASRNIILPEGNYTDNSGTETVSGLGKLKNEYFHALVQEYGVQSYPDTVKWLKQQRDRGRKIAIVSASKNCETILKAAGLEDFFDARVGGLTAEQLHLKGKPAPDIFLEAAQRLNVLPSEAAVFEDALAGVEAGKNGKFALVAGVARVGNGRDLLVHGADLIINEFPE
jgi:beta-phosphoglucomutase family hydrolase